MVRKPSPSDPLDKKDRYEFKIASRAHRFEPVFPVAEERIGDRAINYAGSSDRQTFIIERIAIAWSMTRGRLTIASIVMISAWPTLMIGSERTDPFAPLLLAANGRTVH